VILRADARHIPLHDESVDSIVTDPPYGLEFMGKEWDKLDIRQPGDANYTTNNTPGGRSKVRYSSSPSYGGSVGPGQQAWHLLWAKEAFRVLKPGGHLLAFGGSRTYHRLACAIEDAGFEIRDQMQWIFGQGFPKSLDVSKAIDKAAGIWRGKAGEVRDGDDKRSFGQHYERTAKGSGETAAAAAAAWDGWGTALKPAHEPIVMARKPLVGTVVANVLAHGTGAINVDGCRVGTDGGCQGAGAGAGAGARVFTDALNGTFAPPVPGLGRWPANVIHDGSEEVESSFPESEHGGWPARRSGIGFHEHGSGTNDGVRREAGPGSAARFFYCAKASREDREWALRDGFEKKQRDEGRKEGNPGGDNPLNRGVNKVRNHHPTVKPLDLMRYLCRLVTPPGGIVLDPFAGSGSTLRGAFLEGFKPIGIELDAEYCRIARGRMNLLTPVMAGLA
jgi:site-specific DNA-methyltransferase (adenine-specific)